MEVIDVKRHNGFTTEFVVLPKVKEFFDSRKIDLKDYVPDEFHWYEHELFDLIDENGDGIPDEKFGKYFQVVFYGIIEKWVDKEPHGFVEDFESEKGGIICDATRKINSGEDGQSFFVRYKILVKK